ncbi:hypothetical protein C0J52_11667 [Blattella germanica]|nr:hypothetical protein C0J52_11667 [Blattella germanica]
MVISSLARTDVANFLSVNDNSDEDIKSEAGSKEKEDSKVSVSSSYPESKCDVCHNTIIIYNSDYELSMALHIQQFGEQHAMAAHNSVKNVVDKVSEIAIGEQRINRNQPSKTKSDIVNSATGKSVLESDLAPVECGICKQYIPIRNSDYNLSMALHVRDEFHQIALDLEKKAIKNAKQLASPLKHLDIDLVHYITYSDATKYYCELCKIFMTGIDNVTQHITGSSHTNKLAKKAQDSHIIILSNGIYFCKLCNAPLGSTSNAIDHKIGEKHRKKLAAKEMSENTRKVELEQLMTEEKIWLRNPSTAAAHKRFFKNLTTREALHQDFQVCAARSVFALPVVVYVMAFFYPLSSTVKRFTGLFKRECKDCLFEDKFKITALLM